VGCGALREDHRPPDRASPALHLLVHRQTRCLAAGSARQPHPDRSRSCWVSGCCGRGVVGRRRVGRRQWRCGV
jgi:hypothetical protein